MITILVECYRAVKVHAVRIVKPGKRRPKLVVYHHSKPDKPRSDEQMMARGWPKPECLVVSDHVAQYGMPWVLTLAPLLVQIDVAKALVAHVATGDADTLSLFLACAEGSPDCAECPAAGSDVICDVWRKVAIDQEPLGVAGTQQIADLMEEPASEISWQEEYIFSRLDGGTFPWSKKS